LLLLLFLSLFRLLSTGLWVEEWVWHTAMMAAPFTKYRISHSLLEIPVIKATNIKFRPLKLILCSIFVIEKNLPLIETHSAYFLSSCIPKPKLIVQHFHSITF